MNRGFVILCAPLLVCAIVAAQQPKDSIGVQELDEVVVSDTRFALKRENSGKTVIKITAEELSRFQGKNIAEVINTKSGLELTGSRSREGTIFGVFARGGRGRQVLILIDGVRVSDPSSFSQEYDIRLLSSANVESIEIIKGAASTLYGTNAATAVINIKTKKASEKKISAQVQSSMGTNQTDADQNYNLSRFSNSAQVSGTLNKFHYKIGFSNRFAEGLSDIITPENEEDSFSNINTDLHLGYQVSDKLKFSIFGNQAKIRTDFDESFGLFDAPYQFLSKQERVGLSTTYDYGKGSLSANLAYSTYDSESKSAFPSTFEGSNYFGDVYHKFNFNDKVFSILGINYIEDRTEFEATEKFSITDPYLNMVYISDFGLNLNLGARLNNHSEYGNKFVYNLNPSFSVKSKDGYFKLLTSYATSYITPSLTQLFGSFGANPDLKPEDNRTFEGGVEYANGNGFRASTLYFDRREENFVFYDFSDATYKNANAIINAKGVELELSYRANKKLRFSGNYTFVERKGDNAIRIPKHKINATVDYTFSERFYTSLGYSLTGKRLDTDFSSFPSVDETLDAFSLLNAYASYDCIPDRLKVFLALDNLLNANYIEVIGFTTKGRNVSLGFTLNL